MRQTAEGHDYMRQGLQDEPKDDRTLIGGIPLLMISLIVSKLGFGGLHRANSLRKGKSERRFQSRFRGLVSEPE